MKDFVNKKFNSNFTQEEAEEFCEFFEIVFFDKEEMKEELQEDLRVNEYIMEFVDVKALAEDNNYQEIYNDVFVDNNAIEECKRKLKIFYDNSIKKAMKEIKEYNTK